ncbi:MAG: chromosome segregation protein SMC [Pseudomonadota bacterium]
MHFTKLRLQGFKSFVEPTELAIAAGLTGIVGPNGCGKSNLVEALAWVMGEGRARSLRGQAMDDVIFAGSQSRPARAEARVALVLDDPERAATGALTSSRLEVGRRIARDAGSNYTLNGRNARARDVRLLFADASSGAHSPALVRQGQVAELIAARPQARRRLLEEAAGIAGLAERRAEAERKLSAAAANLARVDERMGDLETSITRLTRQAGEARRYRTLSEALRRAEGVALWLDWQRARLGAETARAALAEATRNARSAEGMARLAEAARADVEAGLTPLREAVVLARAVAERTSIEAARLDEDSARAEAEKAAAAQALAQIEADIANEDTLSEEAETTLKALAEEAAAIERTRAGQEDRLKEAEEAAAATKLRLERVEATLDRLNTEASALAGEREGVRRRLRETTEAEARTAKALAATDAALSTLAPEIETAKHRARDAEATLTTSTTAAKAAETTLAEAEAAARTAAEAETVARGALSAATAKTRALAGEHEALEKLLVRESETTPLLDALTVTPGYEGALGAALGDDLEAPEAPEPGESGWHALPEPRKAKPLPEGAAPLTRKVQGPPALAERLARIGVVSANKGTALQAALRPGQRLVSREGDLWRWDGYTLRANQGRSGAALRLERINRLKAVAASLAEAQAQESAATATAQHAKETAQAATATEKTARNDARTAEKARLAAERVRSETAGALDLAEQRQETLKTERESRASEHAGRVEALEEARAAEAALTDPGTLEQSVAAARQDVAAARQEALSARGLVEETARQDNSQRERLERITREQSRWQERTSRAKSRQEALARRREEAHTRAQTTARAPQEITERRQRLNTQIAQERDRLSTAETACREAEAKAVRAAEEARRAGDVATAAREARARTEALLESAAAAEEAATLRVQTERNATPQALAEALALDQEALPDAAETAAEIERLRRRRAGLGSINLRAEQDLAEIQTERSDLETRKADLDAAIERLRTGLRTLNREGRTRLLAAFERVDARFRELFIHLFGGGEARLVLSEAEDPLEAGLEILCQPPGKKLASLGLLSGGEQTLTALALIFAVFLANPAPLCVLDEVDAPLDDANVGRFCALLDEMVRRTETRFLIVTHHALTMSRMDRLYGVTMAERGVSRLVSVDLGEGRALAETAPPTA